MLDEVLCEDADVVLYRAHTEDGRAVLAKALKVERPSSAEYESLRREADGARAAGADVAAEPEGLTTVDGRPTLFFRDDGGISLIQLLHAPLPLARFFPIALELVEALEKIHDRHLVHGELHPRDILVLWSGEIELIGLGHVEAGDPGASAKRSASTWPYIAPEQTGRVGLPVDRRTDLYTIGMLLFEMLAGRRPFEATDMVGWFHAHCAVVPPRLETIVSDVPPVLARIVEKLLAKTPEARYQSAGGLRHDLARCFEQWSARGAIAPFSLALADPPPPLRFPVRLHGRRDEMRRIHRALESVRERSSLEAILVSGPDGVGKSALLHETLRQAAAVEGRALLAVATCDPHRTCTPGGPLLEALESLLRSALGTSEERPEDLRARFELALGVDAPLLATLLPELARVLGACVPPREVALSESKDRLAIALARFVSALSTRERPVVFIVDNLQWADATTLDVLTRWTLDRSPPMLVVSACRTADLSEDHPLGRAVSMLRAEGRPITEIALPPLSDHAVTTWVADALSSSLEEVAPLVEVISQRTGNAPLFVARLLESLRDRGLVRYSAETGGWRWDIDAVRAERYPDDVAELIAENISALPKPTQTALGHFAAYGSAADLDILALVLDCSEEEVLERLSGAFCARLIARSDGTVRFLHDHIQRTAYDRLGEDKKGVHLHIARALSEQLPKTTLEERVFAVVRQYELAGAQLEEDERIRVAWLELTAGRRAQMATRFASATEFLAAGTRLLEARHWETEHELAFGLHLALLRSHLVSGELDAARELGTTLLTHARTDIDEATVHELLAEVDLLANKAGDAVRRCLVGLRALGIDLPDRPTETIASRAVSEVLERFGGALSTRSFLDNPKATDPHVAAICNLISTIVAPAMLTNWNVLWLAAAAGVTRSLTSGNVSSSPIAYAALAVRLAQEGRRVEAFRLGEAAHALARRPENMAHRPRTGFLFGALASYLCLPIRNGIELLREELELARAVGDQSFTCYLAKHKAHFRFFAGDPLPDVSAASKDAESVAERAGSPVTRDAVASMRRLVAQLRGVESAGEERDLPGAELGLLRFHHLYHDVVARFVRGDCDGAVAAAERALALEGAVTGFLEVPELHFYAALARAASTSGNEATAAKVRKLEVHLAFLRALAAPSPSNFGAREALVAAEIGRLSGADAAAERGYELAIRAARAAAQVHVEAFANECAARFHRRRGPGSVANAYLAQAHVCFEAWGAQQKAREMARSTPPSLQPPVAAQDLELIVKAQQAISSALRLPELYGRLLDVAIEHAGARRGCLLQVGGGHPLSIAATSGPGAACFGSPSTPALPSRVPIALCEGVIRLKKPVFITDALVENRYSFDPYFRTATVRSALCIPIVRDDTVGALLYLENDLVPRVFSGTRVTALALIAAQAAIALENARLYSRLEQENAERRVAEADLARKEKLFEAILDATPQVVFAKDLEGRYILLNRGFEDVFQLDRSQLLGKTDKELLPRQEAAAFRQSDERVLAEDRALVMEEDVNVFGGTRTYLSTKFPLHDVADRQWGTCGISTDVTARKRADDELRRSLSLVEATLESTADGILVTDMKRRVVRLNHRFVTMWRLPEELLRGGDVRPAVEFVRNELVDPESFVAKIEALYADPEAEDSTTLEFKDGRVFDRYSHPQRVAEQVVGRVWSFRDITQRVRDAKERSRLLAEEQQARADAEAAVQIRDEFLSIASHELRTPLASLSLALESLSTYLVEPISPERVRRSAMIAKRQVQRIVSLVDMLLDISRIRSGKLVLSPTRLDLRTVVSDVATLLATELSRAGSELVVRAPEPLIGMWDALRLEQVVTNLLTNAIKFGRGKPIIVELVRDGNEARLAVTDQGIGMPEERRSRIFEPFTRLVSSRHYGGLGLGLHITKTIVEAHGGTIRVDSKEAHGSTFVVTLPLATEH